MPTFLSNGKNGSRNEILMDRKSTGWRDGGALVWAIRKVGSPVPCLVNALSISVVRFPSLLHEFYYRMRFEICVHFLKVLSWSALCKNLVKCSLGQFRLCSVQRARLRCLDLVKIFVGGGFCSKIALRPTLSKGFYSGGDHGLGVWF